MHDLCTLSGFFGSCDGEGKLKGDILRSLSRGDFIIFLMLPQVFEDFIYQGTKLTPETLRIVNARYKKKFNVPLQSTEELWAHREPIVMWHIFVLYGEIRSGVIPAEL